MKNKIYSQKNKYKRIGDFATNIFASILLTGMTQVIVYPLLGRWLSPSEYGTMLTLIGIVNAVGASVGGALNNTRILLNSTYEKNCLSGDYNIVALFCMVACFVITFILSVSIRHTFSLEAVAVSITSLLVFFRAYYSSAYRIQINFRKVLLCNVFGVVGYSIGILIVYLGGKWFWMFFGGEFFSCLYVFFSSFIIRDPLHRTKLMGKLMTRFGCYFVSNSLSYLVSYIDRFFLYPVLGAESVSIYVTASILGKTAGIVLTPITGVLLSYYCKENELSTKQLVKRILLFVACSFVTYSTISCVGYPILEFLYPQLAPSAKPYFYIANLGAIILLLGDAIVPTILRYAKPRWAAIVQALFACAYLSVGFLGMKLNALFGYCIAVIVVNTLRLIILIVVAYKTISNKNSPVNIEAKKK